MSVQENIRLAETIYQAFNRLDFDRCLELATEDVSTYFAPTGESHVGKEGFLAFMKGWKDATPDGQVEIINQVANEDGVVNECVYRATHTGPLVTPDGTIPPTGRTVNLQFVEIWRTRDGKLASLRNYQDMATLMAQLGLLPATQPS